MQNSFVQVSAVRFSKDRRLVDQFECKGVDATNSVRQWCEDRSTIIAKIRSGKKYVAMVVDPKTRATKPGPPIKVVKVEGEEFLKTGTGTAKKDDLDPLPLF